MRQTQQFLREQISGLYPQRVRKVVELPLMFVGDRDEIRYAAALPPRVIEGGVYFFRLTLARNANAGELVLERLIPEPDAAVLPAFDKSERSILADGIAELRIGVLRPRPRIRR